MPPSEEFIAQYKKRNARLLIREKLDKAGTTPLQYVYGSVYPVPADCPAFLRHIGKKDKDICLEVYIGKAEWCAICPLFNRFCDGKEVKYDASKMGKTVDEIREASKVELPKEEEDVTVQD